MNLLHAHEKPKEISFKVLDEFAHDILIAI